MRLRRPLRVVIDASTLVDSLSSTGDRGERVRKTLQDARLVGPEQLRVEAAGAIRGLVLGKKLDEMRANRAIGQLGRMPIGTVRTTALLDRMWELRPNFSGYVAAYVAAAEHLGVPLLTADERLAAAPGPRCPITVV